MTPHLSNEIVERFHAQALAGGDKTVIYVHILGCESCRLRIVDAKTQTVAVGALSEHLLPKEEEEPYHLDYETIEAFVDDKLGAADRNTARLHLEDCAECSAEVEDLRESLATMRAASQKNKDLQPKVVPARWSFLSGVPMRIAAVLAIVAFAGIALLVVWRWKPSGPTQVPGTGGDRTAGSQATPSGSPQIPSFAPSPAIVTPPKLAENPPTKSANEPAAIALKDGEREISIDQAGNIIGLPPLPVDSQQAVKETLTGEPLSRPKVLDEVTSAEVSVRAPTGNEQRIRIISPVSAVILQERPTLRWTPLTTAEGYRIEIADESFRRVAQSEDIPVSSQRWMSSTTLKRGQIYTWTIRALNKGGELSAISSQGKFKILGEDKIRELNQLKARKSHLALGLFFTGEGMIAEAEREFRILVKDNPNSALAKKLLREVRAWRTR